MLVLTLHSLEKKLALNLSSHRLNIPSHRQAAPRLSSRRAHSFLGFCVGQALPVQLPHQAVAIPLPVHSLNLPCERGCRSRISVTG